MSAEVSPLAFRLASLTLEFIERRGVSLEVAFRAALQRVGRREPGALKLARKALLHFAKADMLLKVYGLEKIPSRRKSAFRVAYALLEEGGSLERLEVGILSGRLRSLLSKKRLEEVEQLLRSLQPVYRIAVENSFPPWLVNEIARHLGLSEAEKLVKACSRRTIWVRINELKTTRSKVIETLRKIVDVREDRDFPEVLELVGVEDLPMEVERMVEKGFIVVQDKGSVAVAHALGESRRLLVMDAAAAPGVKTSLLQQLSFNEAEVVAVDASQRRLIEMKKLLSKLNVRNVHLVLSDSRVLKFARKFDKVLLDAPCTNTGAIASDPALRLTLWNPVDVEKFTKLQQALLRNTLENLKVSGTLVYSTCSLLAAEGESVIETVPLDRLSVENVWGLPGYSGYSCSGKVRRLYPHVHRTTGFFTAKVTSQ